jgi:hypothetical protein
MTKINFKEDLENAIKTYEKLIGKLASRTRQMIDTYGAHEALSKLVKSADLQKGFIVLKDCGKLDESFEAVIIRHSEEFRDEIIECAKWRLEQAEN